MSFFWKCTYYSLEQWTNSLNEQHLFQSTKYIYRCIYKIHDHYYHKNRDKRTLKQQQSLLTYKVLPSHSFNKLCVHHWCTTKLPFYSFECGISCLDLGQCIQKISSDNIYYIQWPLLNKSYYLLDLYSVYHFHEWTDKKLLKQLSKYKMRNTRVN